MQIPSSLLQHSCFARWSSSNRDGLRIRCVSIAGTSLLYLMTRVCPLPSSHAHNSRGYTHSVLFAKRLTYKLSLHYKVLHCSPPAAHAKVFMVRVKDDSLHRKKLTGAGSSCDLGYVSAYTCNVIGRGSVCYMYTVHLQSQEMLAHLQHCSRPGEPVLAIQVDQFILQHQPLCSRG
ncbi:hypothetical protein ElyMa_005709200 [Elysia marginata]|uniref:Uncharacterized protein n=1 Tax=Elysia marginata TaxID=1093978 RepID=A0AAV4FHP2_9GAST|nr:hypothetical protein ElyMa_005709200 [Elysia marginata]